MSFRSKQELLQQTAPRYQEAPEAEKVAILNEFVAATGYARKYAIRVVLATQDIRSKKCVVDDAIRSFPNPSLQHADGDTIAHAAIYCFILERIS